MWRSFEKLQNSSLPWSVTLIASEASTRAAADTAAANALATEVARATAAEQANAAAIVAEETARIAADSTEAAARAAADTALGARIDDVLSNIGFGGSVKSELSYIENVKTFPKNTNYTNV